jgi:molecular chaperone GrpE
MTEKKNNDLQNEVNSKTTTAQNEELKTSKEKIEDQAESKNILKEDEIKKLEEKDHYELEYFSKEEAIEKIKNLEKETQELKGKVKKLEEQNQQSKDKYMRLQAEFENAQKRWDKNRQNLRTEYTASVLRSFLPLHDSFKKALESGNEEEKKMLDGFFNQFKNIFKSYGAEPIHVVINEKFDYNLHEALSSIEKEDVPENTILEVIQDGWKYGKEVIRYAKVIISKKPKPPEPKLKEENEGEVQKPEEHKESNQDDSNKKDSKEQKKLKKEKKSKD